MSGYTKTEIPIEDIVPMELAEITLSASQMELRKMAAFFEWCASEMDRMGSAYSHVHLADWAKEFQSSAHLVVVRPD